MCNVGIDFWGHLLGFGGFVALGLKGSGALRLLEVMQA